MQIKIVGCKHIQGTNKKGNAYNGTLVSFVYNQRGYTGNKAEEMYVDSSMILPEEIIPGDLYDLDRDNGYINDLVKSK